ncbi:MAG TPA: carboxypeptidase-like regulatory domain-containing protein [Candidatus Polarisedimenticolaceae bacterium]
MRSMIFGRALAVALALAVVAFSSPTAIRAADATLLGRVTDAPGASPRPGVVVALYDPATQATYRSEPTDARGAFRIGDAQSGTYQVVVEAAEGAYLAGNAVALKSGDNPPLSVALRPASQEGGTAPAAGSGSKQAPWVKWVIAGGIILGGALIVNAVTDDEQEASGFGQPAK